MINSKLYVDILSRQAKKDGRPHEMALSDFCDFLLDLFSVEAFKGKGADGLKNWFDERISKKPDFGLLATNWLVDVSTALQKGTWLDAFGILYEDMYLTRGKASQTGQFFTPKSVSDLVSDIIGSKEKQASSPVISGKMVNDCAAGSGRLLLSHFAKMSSPDPSVGRTYKYIAQDSDPLACKMCALNMMAHGMNGVVICQDTLAMSKPTATYYINEVKYPFITPYYSVRIKSGNPAK